ncbi:MAG TPA: hypothetical protein VFO85_17000, partial [Vicinamibacteria bacterium]|nr:hypothetical protein [Vicinamibacteria bacterium]
DYVDSVVGAKHSVDVALPRDALAAATSGRRSPDVEARYGEPLAALQDDDLQLPDAVEFAFYAAYNCYRRHAQEADVDDWLIVNQALAALPETEQRPALARALAAAGE